MRRRMDRMDEDEQAYCDDVIGFFDEMEVNAKIAFVVAGEGDLLAMGGAHGNWGWCWCQPDVTYRPCPRGHQHAMVVHRRSQDETRAQWDARTDAGWRMSDDNVVFPRRNWPLPMDTPDPDA